MYCLILYSTLVLERLQNIYFIQNKSSTLPLHPARKSLDYLLLYFNFEMPQGTSISKKLIIKDCKQTILCLKPS